jgi:hypothetical protein
MSGSFTGEDRRGRESWHLDKRINLSHIAATGALLASVVIGWNKLDNRISVVEKGLELTSAFHQQQLSDIKTALDRIEQKIDRKADKGGR